MEKTIRSLPSINFPVYELSGEPIAVDGLVYLEGKVIDDRNVSAKTLGHRRLLTPHPLKRLITHRVDIIDLLKKQKSTSSWYIDNLGSVFTYNKAIEGKLICHSIEQVLLKNFYSLLLIEGINFPIIVERPPVGQYAQILYIYGFPWKLYNITDEYVNKARKKV